MGSSTTNQAVATLVPRLGEARRNEARIFALQIVRDPAYRTNLLLAARNRTIPPGIESLLWHYAFGKPVETVEVGRIGESNYEELSREALINRAVELADRLRLAPRSPDEIEGATDVAITTATTEPPLPAKEVASAMPVVGGNAKPIETSAARAARLARKPSLASLVVDEVGARRVLRDLGVDDANPEGDDV